MSIKIYNYKIYNKNIIVKSNVHYTNKLIGLIRIRALFLKTADI